MIDKVTTVEEDGTVIAEIMPDGTVVAEVKPIGVGTAVAEFDPIAAGLAQLTDDIAGTQYDITTTKGLDTAKRLRALCVKLRTNAGEVYDKLNRPMLDKQTLIRKLKAQFVTGIEALEGPIDLAIKAQEKVKEAERQAKAAAEEVRIKALRDKIAVISALPAKAVLRDAAGIAALDQALAALVVDEVSFVEFEAEAAELKAFVRSQLGELFVGASNREAEAERVRIEAERLESQRQQQLVENALRAKIFVIQSHALKALHLDHDGILACIHALPAVSPEEFGALYDEAVMAWRGAREQLDSMRQARVLIDQVAKAASDKQQAEAEARQREDDERAERQRVADEEHANSVKALRTQQDAFEAERVEAKRIQDAREAEQAEEKRLLQEQIKALQPKPMPEPTPEPASPAAPVVAEAPVAAALPTLVTPPAVAQVALELEVQATRPSDMLIVTTLAEVFDASINDVIDWLSAFNAEAVHDAMEQEEFTS